MLTVDQTCDRPSPSLTVENVVEVVCSSFVHLQEFYLALWQCYGRYLTSFGDVNVEEITSVEQFKQEFFPDGFETEDAGFTVNAQSVDFMV